MKTEYVVLALLIAVAVGVAVYLFGKGVADQMSVASVYAGPSADVRSLYAGPVRDEPSKAQTTASKFVDQSEYDKSAVDIK